MEMMKICPVCGKEWEILDSEAWAYKVRPSKSRTIYFCRYNCKQKWLREHQKPQKPIHISEVDKVPGARRTPMSSRELIEKVLEAISEGESGAEVLERLGYEHWKKWHNLKKWAEGHDPGLRKLMPETLADRRRKEAKEPPVEPAAVQQPKVDPRSITIQDPMKWDKWITPAEELGEPDIQIIAVRTELGEFACRDGEKISWFFGEHVTGMQAELSREEWMDFSQKIIPAVLETLGKEDAQ